MEDLKEYFEGHMKGSITGELYHGSPKRMDVILPHTASHGRPYVYASPDYLFSLCYAGLQWNDFEINQSYYNGELYLTEIQRGQFREKLQRPGYVYHLNKDDFKKLPNSADAEFVSEQAVSPLAVDEIPNVYRRLVSKGVHLYEYPNLPPFIDDREGYIISKAEDLYVQDNPEMYQYLVKTFPGIVAKALKDYVDEYGKESVSEIDTLNTYTDNEEGTVKQESVISDAADISGENKSDSDIFIEKKKGSSEKLYFVSESSDWDDGRMMPRIPDNFMTRNGYEDNTTPRVCFSTSIDGCLRALSMNLAGKEFYVYTPDPDGIYDVITPTVKQVPDVKLTHERWITTPVDTVLIGKIKVIKDAGGPPLEYKYGDKTASLYDWEWKWISKRDGSVTKESAGDEIPKVYFTKDITPESLIRLYYKISAGKNLSGNVMVKISTGEPGGHNFLQPSLIGPLVNVVHGTICDANTAYGGPRSTTESHYQVMKDHGFADIAPVDVLDGDGEIEIPVNNGYHLKTLPVGSHNSNYGTFLILTHFKGHAMAGFGGAMKNIAIGMASARGKAIVHSAGKSETEITGHPQQPFLQSMVDSLKASIDYGGRENFLYINVANNLSVDCDCDAHPAPPTMKDIGVFASTDPLAIDQACIDAVDRAADNKDLVARIKRQTGRNILKYAEDAGIGSRKYELVDLDKEESITESTDDITEYEILDDRSFYEVTMDLIDKGLYAETFKSNLEIREIANKYSEAFHRACHDMTDKDINSLIDSAISAVKPIVDKYKGFEIYSARKSPDGLIYDDKMHKRFILDDDSAYLNIVTFRFPKLFEGIKGEGGATKFPQELLDSFEFKTFLTVVRKIFVALAENGFMGTLYYGNNGEGVICINSCAMSVLMSKNSSQYKKMIQNVVNKPSQESVDDLIGSMDSLLDDMFKEYSYPPHREEPMDTTPEQTVPSEHSFLRDDEDEEKPKPGFSSSIKTEGVVISKDDTVIGLDRWKPEKGKNILLITGLSGSGKSTLAEEYETKYRAHMFELDGLEHRYDSSGTAKVLQKVREKCPEYDEYFKDRSQKAADNIDVLWKAADVALDVMKEDYKTLYIVEGVQLYDGLYSDEVLKGKPLIIKNTSHLTSIIRALKRTSETDDKSFAKAIKENLPEILSYHRKSYKPFKKFKEKFAKESVSELDDLFNDAIRSFSITQESSDSPIMQIDPDDLRSQFTTELTTVSELDENHETKEKKSLSSFKQIVCDEGEFDKWKQKFSEFRHVRMSDHCMFTFWVDNDDNLVAYVNIEEKDDHHVIQALEVSKKYQGSGLGSQLLKYAEKNHANMLWVNPGNKIAVEMYKKAGWKYGKNKNRGKLQPMYKESTNTVLESVNLATRPDRGFNKIKEVVDSLDDKELHYICGGEFKDSKRVIYRFTEERNGRIVGFVDCYRWSPTEARIVLAVHPDYRGEGVARSLVNKLLKSVDENKITTLIWEYDLENLASKKLGESFGFKSVKSDESDTGKMTLDLTNEAAGVMEFLPYVGVKKDPPPDTDYPGSPFKALEESYETVFEFKNEEAGECVSVMETPFATESVFLKVDEYHYPDIIHELVEDVITDIENGSEDYAEKANLVWYITGENAEPLCAVAEDVGFVPIPSIDPTRNDIFTYAMDIHEFTPEKTQYATEAVDVTTIFRADEDYIYLNVPYCEFYIPTEYFAMGKKFAEDFTDKIHTIGLFNIGIFEDDKLVDVKVFNVPIYLDIMVYDYDVRMIDVGSGTPVECRVYKYYQDSIICRSFIAENSGVAQTFLQLIISGSMPGTIPYSQCLSVWRKNLELSGVNLGVSSAIMEMILAVMYRDAKDPSKKYCIRYGSSADSSEFDYMSASIRQICQYNSTFTGIIYEDIDSMITSAINRNRNGKEEGETPMEKIIKM